MNKTIILCISALAMSFISCNTGDTVYKLSESEKAILNVYPTGRQFQLRNLASNEIVALEVTSNEIETVKYDPSGYPLGIGGFGNSGDDYVQIGTARFTDVSGCYSGEFKILGSTSDEYAVRLFTGDCFEADGGDASSSSETVSITANGVVYPDCIRIFSYGYGYIYFSKTVGIVRIDQYPDTPRFELVN